MSVSSLFLQGSSPAVTAYSGERTNASLVRVKDMLASLRPSIPLAKTLSMKRQVSAVTEDSCSSGESLCLPVIYRTYEREIKYQLCKHGYTGDYLDSCSSYDPESLRRSYSTDIGAESNSFDLLTFASNDVQNRLLPTNSVELEGTTINATDNKATRPLRHSHTSINLLSGTFLDGAVAALEGVWRSPSHSHRDVELQEPTKTRKDNAIHTAFWSKDDPSNAATTMSSSHSEATVAPHLTQIAKHSDACRELGNALVLVYKTSAIPPRHVGHNTMNLEMRSNSCLEDECIIGDEDPVINDMSIPRSISSVSISKSTVPNTQSHKDDTEEPPSAPTRSRLVSSRTPKTSGMVGVHKEDGVQALPSAPTHQSNRRPRSKLSCRLPKKTVRFKSEKKGFGKRRSSIRNESPVDSNL